MGRHSYGHTITIFLPLVVRILDAAAHHGSLADENVDVLAPVVELDMFHQTQSRLAEDREPLLGRPTREECFVEAQSKFGLLEYAGEVFDADLTTDVRETAEDGLCRVARPVSCGEQDPWWLLGFAETVDLIAELFWQIEEAGGSAGGCCGWGLDDAWRGV